MTPDAPTNQSGLTQLIMMGKSIRQIWVKRLNISLVKTYVSANIHFSGCKSYTLHKMGGWSQECCLTVMSSVSISCQVGTQPWYVSNSKLCYGRYL